MIDEIKKWIEQYYSNDYEFNEPEFLEIIKKLTPIIQEFTPEEANYVNGILGKILDKYAIKDYYYVIEIFEYEFVPLFIES